MMKMKKMMMMMVVMRMITCRSVLQVAITDYWVLIHNQAAANV